MYNIGDFVYYVAYLDIEKAYINIQKGKVEYIDNQFELVRVKSDEDHQIIPIYKKDCDYSIDYTLEGLKGKVIDYYKNHLDLFIERIKEVE